MDKSRFKNIVNDVRSHFRDYKKKSSQPISKKFNKNDVIHILNITFVSFNKRLKAGILYHEQFINSDKTNFTIEILEDWLIYEKENIKVEEEVLNLIAKYSDGGLRDAINLLDKLACCSTNITIDDFYEIKGIVKEEELFDIVSALVNGNTKEALEKLDNKKHK